MDMIKKMFLILGIASVILINTVERIKAEDMEVTMPSGSSAFVIKDSSSNEVFRVQSDGNVGIGTANPGVPLSFGQKPFELIRFWDGGTTASSAGIGVAADDLQIFLGPTSNVFTIRRGGFQGPELFRLTAMGNVGIGTAAPEQRLHVAGDKANLTVGPFSTLTSFTTGAIETSGQFNGFAFTRRDLTAKPASLTAGDAYVWYSPDSTSARLWTTVNGDLLAVTPTGNVGIGTTNPQGKLDINGKIFQRGIELHADYVFESDYNLESVDAHSAFMWQNKHLKGIPKAKVDENGMEIVEVGSHRKGIVEELEKAHIYIEQLHNQNKTLEKRVAKLEGLINRLADKM